MKKAYFITFIILTILGIVFLILSDIQDFRPLFLNITTDIIGIIITVFLVERVISYYIGYYWHIPELKINSNLQGITYEIVSNIAGGLGFKRDDIFNVNKIVTGKKKEVQEEIIRGIDEELIPLNIEEKLNSYTEDQWNLLEMRLDENHKKIDHFISLFGQKLTPTIFDYILDLREAHASALRIPRFAERKDVKIDDNVLSAIISARIFSICDSSKNLLEHLKKKVF